MYETNERIKELAEQAGMTDDKYGMYFAKDKHNEGGVDLEKFAELVVCECDQYVTKYWDEMEPWMNPGDLLIHFGIEEGE